MGRALIKEGLADDTRSLGDLMLEHKLGILDVISEEGDERHLTMDIRVMSASSVRAFQTSDAPSASLRQA
ncbi:hypothetical protein [Methanothermobacter sp. THM-2]|uniref:hypothetical protein n=1 Tax=Methanothermobacter sp. THM-2 TaxID=2606912 RepID=UPI001F5B7490|nr:hypothetical protein [Methanothermobacter sp. THM-2]